MQKIETLGQFEQLVLGAVKTIPNAYGPPIHQQVERIYGMPVKLASIYTTLDRLEEKGYITWRVADPTPERGNKPKRYYSIAPAGEEALKQSAETAERFLETLRANECNPARGIVRENV